MGRLFEFIFFVVVAYFIFKFLNNFFSRKPSNNNNRNTRNQTQSQYKQQQTSSKSNINWDAETIDYEEIEPKENEKK